MRPGLRAGPRGPGARAARAGASPAQVGSGLSRTNFARIAPALGAQSLLPAGGVSGGRCVGRKWRKTGGGGGAGRGGRAEPGACAGTPGCPPSRLGRRPASQRRGRGGRAGGSGLERGAFREEDSPRAPAARPLASRETPEERLRRSDLPPSGFASAAHGHLERPEPHTPHGCPRVVGGPRATRARPCALDRKAPARGCELPLLPSGSGQLLSARESPSSHPPRLSMRGTAVAPGDDSGNRPNRGGSAGLRGEAPPGAEEGLDAASVPRGSPWFRRPTSSPGKKGDLQTPNIWG